LWEKHKFEVFKNRVLRKTFELMRQSVIDGSIKLHNEEIQNLSSSSNVIQVIELRKKRWEGHVTFR
jgi:hypothetical protein